MLTPTTPLKPFLKWAGGKRQLLSEIWMHLPKDIEKFTYYEPFAGAGAVFFELQLKKAVINDINKQLINVYRVIRDNVKGIVLLLEEYKKNNDNEFFYEIRNLDREPSVFNKLTDTEKAARFIYLNKTCYNGLYRVNSKGFFNVPYGRYNNPAIFDKDVLYQINKYFNSCDIRILCCDFESAVSYADKNAFVYFDPPYHSPDKKNFTSYQADKFDELQQERLCNVMINLTEKGVKCLLSSSDTGFIRELYSKKFFKIIPVQAKRTINSRPSGRGVVNEILVKNWKD